MDRMRYQQRGAQQVKQCLTCKRRGIKAKGKKMMEVAEVISIRILTTNLREESATSHQMSRIGHICSQMSKGTSNKFAVPKVGSMMD